MSALVDHDPLMVARNRGYRHYGKRREVGTTEVVEVTHFVDRSRLSDLYFGADLAQLSQPASLTEETRFTVLHGCRIRTSKLRVKIVSSKIHVGDTGERIRAYLKSIARVTTEPLAKWREEVRGFSNLAKGWDSYDAGPPSQLAIDIALEIIDALEVSGVAPEYIIPTSDESILFKHAHGDSSYLWEIESDGEIGLMIESADGSSTFHRVEQEQVLDFLDECEVNV